jgi:hypothetical protein
MLREKYYRKDGSFYEPFSILMGESSKKPSETYIVFDVIDHSYSISGLRILCHRILTNYSKKSRQAQLKGAGTG